MLAYNGRTRQVRVLQDSQRLTFTGAVVLGSAAVERKICQRLLERDGHDDEKIKRIKVWKETSRASYASLLLVSAFLGGHSSSPCGTH